MNLARKSHASSVKGYFLFVFGGMDKDLRPVEPIETLDLGMKKGKWTSLKGAVCERIDPVTCSIEGDKILVFGGRNYECESLQDVSTFDTMSMTFSTLVKDSGYIMGSRSAH